MNQLYANVMVLVTGGAGFIGSHITEQLVNAGAQVTVLDNLSTGSLDNLAAVKDKITFIEGDILDYNQCLAATKDQEIIFHLAAFISVPDSIANPTECFNTNVIGTMNVLKAAEANDCKRFVFSSSAAVYGPQTDPCHEEMHCQPESPYGHSKLIGELQCQQFNKTCKLETVMLRYFNVHGPRQNPNGAYAGVMAKFMNNLQQNKPITIFGDGKQTRDFVHVAQVAQANLTVAMSPTETVAGKVFNVASGKTTTLLQMLDELKSNFPQFNADITFAPARVGDIKHSHAVIEKLRNINL